MKPALHRFAPVVLLAAVSAPLCAQTLDPNVPSYPERKAYFGDLHLHTSASYDAAWATTRTTRTDAYNYAKGLPVMYLGHEVKRKAALDFLAVTDHSEYMGVAVALAEKDPMFKDSEWVEKMFGSDGAPGAGFRSIMSSAFYGPDVYKELNSREIKQTNWKAVIADADKAYQPGKFTALVGYEWSNTPDGSHFHRVVLFKGPRYPDVPFSALDSRDPEDLWKYADNNRKNGIDSILVPHNMNLSGGRQFSYNKMNGDPIDRDFALTKDRNERLMEVSQIKGTSETTPELSPDDEFAGFELMEEWNKGKKMSPHGSYIREGLARGMEIAEKIGVNPYRIGFEGGTDHHSGTSATEEDNYTGALGNSDAPWGDNIKTLLAAHNAVLNAPTVALAASGLSGVWAEQNTREGIFAALKRRETFATSGPRMQVRMFAGWNYPAGLTGQNDWVKQAYAGGVPMGGDLKADAKGKSPRFLLQAVKEPDGANLDRVQVIKVWRRNGQSFEKVYDVLWANSSTGARKPDAKTGKVGDIGSSVDVAHASYTNSIGATQLIGEWTDPDFNAKDSAAWYARVIEIPTPRWSTYLAVRNNLPVPTTVPPTHQERAWTSPIFYQP
ncbi:MAG TPA: DUF3604 domain-containing protein [Candidatus Acidoferrum sp.]|nr:DUF3604 domain-containing protein [Candidatus Acidoferrum sp.]